MTRSAAPVDGPRTTRPFALDEVQAAVRALQAGEFRHARPTSNPTGNPTGRATSEPATHPDRTGQDRGQRSFEAASWTPEAGERVVAVIGSAGSTGASTVALAIAMSADVPARVVECCSASASGLAAASTAELGLHPSGWRQGKRDQVLIERASEVLAGVDEVPAPTSTEHAAQLTVLDIGWEIGQLVATDSWVTDALAAAAQIVVVTTATIPGMRRLDGALELLGTQGSPSPHGGPGAPEQGGALSERTWVAVLGPRRKKWSRGIEHAGGPTARRVLASDRLVEIPEDRGLAVHGLDSRPVPPALLSAAARLHAAPPDPTADPTADTALVADQHSDDYDHDPDQPDLFGQTN